MRSSPIRSVFLASDQFKDTESAAAFGNTMHCIRHKYTTQPELDEEPAVFEPLIFLVGPLFLVDGALDGAAVDSYKIEQIHCQYSGIILRIEVF